MNCYSESALIATTVIKLFSEKRYLGSGIYLFSRLTFLRDMVLSISSDSSNQK